MPTKLTFETVREIALSLTGAEESTSYGTPAIKLRGKPFIRLKEDGATIVLWTTFEERQRLVKEQPAVFFWTEHYERYPMVLARLGTLTKPVLKKFIAASYAVIDAATTKSADRTGTKRSRRSRT